LHETVVVPVLAVNVKAVAAAVTIGDDMWKLLTPPFPAFANIIVLDCASLKVSVIGLVPASFRLHWTSVT
jgi:hypothetical protein